MSDTEDIEQDICGSGDEEEMQCESASSFESIKKNLLSDLSDDSPLKTFAVPAPPASRSASTDGPEKMRVFLRIRPLSTTEQNKNENVDCIVVPASTQVDMVAPKDSRAYEHSSHGCGKMINSFTFSHVYDRSTTQKEFFDGCIYSTVKDFIDGQNCLVFAYGVTNSGKTYTMQGPPKDVGVIPRSLEMIFNSIEGRQHESADLRPSLYCEVKRVSGKELVATEKFKTMVLNAATRLGSNSDADLYSSNESLASLTSLGEYSVDSLEEEDTVSRVSLLSQTNILFSVWISFAEIYNEHIYDLLEPISKNQKRKMLQLKEDKKGNPYVKELRQVHCTSVEEAVKVLTFGQKNLQYACTKLNDSSSRSHCIFQVKMLRVVDKANPNVVQMSMLSFCDLAGSERYARTQAQGDRLKEAANINTSLLTLGRCIQLLRHNQIHKKSERVVPFRESKLTRLFQNFFSGKGKASMIVNVSPAASAFDENIQALKFSAIAKQVQFIPEKIPEPSKPKARTDVSIALARFEDSSTSRPSIPWGSEEDLHQTVNKMDEIEEDAEETMQQTFTEEEDAEFLADQATQQMINKLKTALLETVEALKQEKKARREQEIQLREEISSEMMSQITKIENHYEEQLEEERQRQGELAEKKIAIFQDALHKSVKRKNKELNEVKETTISLAVLQAEQVKLQERNQQIEDLSLKLSNLQTTVEAKSAEIEQLHVELEQIKKQHGDQAEVKSSSKDKDNETKPICEKCQAKCDDHEDLISKLREELARAEEAKPSSEVDITDNEIFISITAQLKEAKQSETEKIAEIQELQQTLEEAGETFQQKEQLLETLKSEGELSRQKLDSLTNQLAESKTNSDQKLAVLDEEMKTKDAQIEKQEQTILLLQQEVKGINTCMENKMRELELASKEIAQLQARASELTNQQQMSLSEIERQNSVKIEELEQEVLAVSRGLQTAAREKESVEEELKTCQDKIEHHEFSYNELEIQYQTANEKLTSEITKLKDAMELQCTDHEGIYATLQTKLLAATRELEREKKEKDVIDGKLSQYKTDILELHQSPKCDKCSLFEENVQKLMDAQCTIESLQDEVTNTKNGCQISVAAVKAELHTAQISSQDAAKELETTAAALEVLKVQLSMSQDETKEKEELYTSKEKDFLTATQENVELKSRLDEKQGLLELADSDRLKHETLAGKHLEELSAVVAERDGLKEENANMWSELHSARGLSSDAQNDLVTQEAKCERLANRITTLTAECDKLKEENSKLQSEFKHMEKVADASERVDYLSTELKQAQEEHKCTIEALKKEFSENEGKLIQEKREIEDNLVQCQSDLAVEKDKCEKFAAMAKRVDGISEKLDQQKNLHDTALTKLQLLTEENRLLKEELKKSKVESAAKKSSAESTISALKENVNSKEQKAESMRVILDARQQEWDRKDECHSMVKKELQKAVSVEKDLRAELAKLSRDFIKQSDELSDRETKLQSETESSLGKEKELRAQITSLEDKIISQEKHLKNQDDLLKGKCSLEKQGLKKQETMIDGLKEALNEQEITMNVQDQVIKSKEEQLRQLSQECLDWQTKFEALKNDESEKATFTQRLTAIQNERDFLQGMQKKMMDEVSTLTKLNTQLTSELEELKKTKLKKVNDNSQAIMLKECENELLIVKSEMAAWQRSKEDKISELEKALVDKHALIEELEKSSQQDIQFDDMVAKKEELIGQLETKIENQEATIKHLSAGSRTTRQSSRMKTEDQRRVQHLEQELTIEKSRHSETQTALDRVLAAKDEQVADLKEANEKLQKELEKHDMIHKKPRRSDKFKEPQFITDKELSASTCELDVTPKSAKKKAASLRKSTRKPTQKENIVGTYAKKLLVTLSPMKVPLKTEQPQEEDPGKRTRRRRKLYTADDEMITSPNEEVASKKSHTDVHGLVKRSLRSLNLK